MRGKHASDDLAKSIYCFKDANMDYANSAIARIFSISESTLRGILKRRIRRSDRQKKSEIGSKSVLTRRIKRQLLGRVNRNPKFRLSDLLLTARRLVSKATSHRFLRNRGIRNRVAVQEVLTIAQKVRRVNWCRRRLFVDFTKVIFSDETVVSLRPSKKFGRIYVYRKLVKNFYTDLLPAHPKFYSEDPSQYGAACRIGVSVAWKRLLVPWIANIMWRKH